MKKPFIHVMSKDTCNHQWDGPRMILSGGLGEAMTCSKCGLDAMTHSLRTSHNEDVTSHD